MNALPYLFFTTLKNRIISFFQKPANWISALVMAALLGFVVFTGGMDQLSTVRPIEELYAVISILYIAMFAIIAYRGVHKGTTLFSMADIHLLFPAPIKPQSILLYGLIKQMGTSLTVGFFLLFQYAWVHQQYGVPMTFLLLTLLGYGLTLFLGQLTAMTLYSLTHMHDSRRKAVKLGLLLICGLGAIYVVLPVLSNSSNWAAIGARQLAGMPMLLFPIGGWMRALVEGVWQGSGIQALWATGIGIAYTAFCIVLLGKKQTDFYEDVLKSTETLHQSLALKREGKLQEVLPENIKIGKTGLNKGQGASVLYYKHRLESRRARRFLLDTMTMIMLLSSLVFSFIMREQGLAAAFSFATYMQLFTVATGRWVKELARPYIYMIPETSFHKLLHCLRESMLGFVLEAVLLMVPMGLILKMQPLDIAIAVVARISFSILFVAGNLLLEKLFAGMKLKVLLIMLYFLTMILLIAPGVALGIVLYSNGILFLSEAFTVLSVITVMNLMISPLILYLCRNVLNNPEWGNS